MWADMTKNDKIPLQCNVYVVKKITLEEISREILSTVLFRNTINQTYPSNQNFKVKIIIIIIIIIII